VNAILDSKGTGDFPKKYAEKESEGGSERHRHLLDLELKDVEVPDYVRLDYAVCAIDKEPCGWSGWIIDGVFKIMGRKHPTGTGDKVLPARTNNRCPACGRALFSTVSVRFNRG